MAEGGQKFPESLGTSAALPTSGSNADTSNRTFSCGALKTSIMRPHTRRCPPFKSSFIKTQDYEACLETAKTSPMVIVMGEGGSGKHLTCRQVVRTLWLDGKNKDSHRFYDLKLKRKLSNLNISSITSEHGSMPPAKDFQLPQYLLHVFQVMSKKDDRNFVLLDACELDRDLTDHVVAECLNEFFQEISPDNWTILCMTDNLLQISRDPNTNISCRNFLQMKGLEIQDIGKMLSISSSDEFDEDTVQDYASRIKNEVGLHLPLDVKLIVAALVENVDPDDDFFNQYRHQLHKGPFPESQASLNVAMTNIERCLAEDENLRESRMRFLGMLSFINHKEVPVSWLISFAEIAHLNDGPPVASKHVGRTMARLIDFNLCSRQRKSKGIPQTFSVKAIIQVAMRALFEGFTEEKRLDIVRDCLIAVIREMPREGHRYSPKQMNNFLKHACEMKEQLRSQELKVSSSDDPRLKLIMLLHSKFLCGMGYCLVALRRWPEGEYYYMLAVDKYYETVNTSHAYSKLSDKSECASRGMELYAAGKNCQFISTDVFHDFIGDLPRFHRFTDNSLKHMKDVSKSEMVNNHLSRECYERLLREGRVLYEIVAGKKRADVKKMAKVHMGEFLARIFSSWAKVYMRANMSPDFKESSDSYEQLALTANQICKAVEKDFGVCLLESMICSRTVELYKLNSVGSFAQACESENRWVGLSGRHSQCEPQTQSSTGTQSSASAGSSDRHLPASSTAQRTRVYECGIAKSEFETDGYHMLGCLQGKLLAVGKKHANLQQEESRRQIVLQQGEELMREILHHIDQLNHSSHSFSIPSSRTSSTTAPAHDYWSLGKAHKSFAQYHGFCGNYEKAIRNIIHAMEYIRQANSEKLDPENLPFVQLKAELQHYHEKRLQLQPCQPFIQPDEPEVAIMDNLIKSIPCPRDFNQPEEANPHSIRLEDIRNKIVVRQAIEFHGDAEVSIEGQSLARPDSRPVQPSDAR